MNDFTNPAELLERVMQTAKTALPESLGQDVRNSVKSALQDVLLELDVVSREEFDAQKKVLQKARTKIDRMEKLIADIEKQLGS